MYSSICLFIEDSNSWRKRCLNAFANCIFIFSSFCCCFFSCYSRCSISYWSGEYLFNRSSLFCFYSSKESTSLGAFKDLLAKGSNPLCYSNCLIFCKMSLSIYLDSMFLSRMWLRILFSNCSWCKCLSSLMWNFEASSLFFCKSCLKFNESEIGTFIKRES